MLTKILEEPSKQYAQNVKLVDDILIDLYSNIMVGKELDRINIWSSNIFNKLLIENVAN